MCFDKKVHEESKKKLAEVYGHKPLKIVSIQQNSGKNCFAKMATCQQKILDKKS